MAGDEEDVLLEIDRILAGEDEEPETVEEESDEGGEGEPNDSNNEITEESEAPIADFDFGVDDSAEDTTETGDRRPTTPSSPDRIGRTELVAILLSRKTKLHFMALLALLIAFWVVKNISVDLLLMLGYGGNESFEGDAGIQKFLNQYRKLIADLRSRSGPKARVVILSIPPQQRPGLRRLNTTVPVTSKFTRSDLDSPIERNRQIGRYNTALANFALRDGHAHLDLNAPFQELWDQPRQQFRRLFTVDGRALNSEGYRVATCGVLAQLFPTSTLTVRLKQGEPPQVIGPLATSGAEFQQRRLTLSSRVGSFVLRVHGLRRKGRYTLRIDRDNFGDHTAKEFAVGIAPQLLQPAAGLLGQHPEQRYGAHVGRLRQQQLQL